MTDLISSPTSALVLTLFIVALAIPYLLPRLGAALGLLMVGYGGLLLANLDHTKFLWDLDRTIGIIAIVYGLVWLALGAARHVLKQRALEAV